MSDDPAAFLVLTDYDTGEPVCFRADRITGVTSGGGKASGRAVVHLDGTPYIVTENLTEVVSRLTKLGELSEQDRQPDEEQADE